MSRFGLQEFHRRIPRGKVIHRRMAGFEDAIARTRVGDHAAIEHDPQSFADFLQSRRARLVPRGFLTGLRFYALRFEHVERFQIFDGAPIHFGRWQMQADQ